LARTAVFAFTALIVFGISNPVHAQVATAYINPVGKFTPYSGAPFGLVSWGMDFDVNLPVLVTNLGTYDFQQDSVFLHDVSVGIFNRDTQALASNVLTFTTSSPGSLQLGSRFKSLGPALLLTSGFHGSIVAFGITEAGSGGEPLVDESNQNSPTWSLNDSGGLLSFVGTSRLVSSSSLTYPTTPDTFVVHPAFAPNQYMAGTFQFTAVPEPGSLTLLGVALLSVLRFSRRQAKSLRDSGTDRVN
jgi:PEP-CTERM motif